MYITFIPHNVPDNDLVSDDVLWLMSYKIYKKNVVEKELISFLDKRIGIAYPLNFWEENLFLPKNTIPNDIVNISS